MAGDPAAGGRRDRRSGVASSTHGHMTATDSSFIFGVDLDGVCGDYTGALREIVARHRQVDPGSLPLERSWDFREWGLSPTEFERIHQAAVLEHRIFRTMPAFDGAAEVCGRPAQSGGWI